MAREGRSMADQGLMTTDELAAYRGMSRQAVDTERWRGQGPPFVRDGRRVRYRRADVDAWIAARVVQPTPRAAS